MTDISQERIDWDAQFNPEQIEGMSDQERAALIAETREGMRRLHYVVDLLLNHSSKSLYHGQVTHACNILDPPTPEQAAYAEQEAFEMGWG